jgi:hypothetical protein
LRPIVRDRSKCKELVDNFCSWWKDGLYFILFLFLLLLLSSFLVTVFFLPWYFSSWASDYYYYYYATYIKYIFSATESRFLPNASKYINRPPDSILQTPTKSLFRQTLQYSPSQYHCISWCKSRYCRYLILIVH